MSSSIQALFQPKEPRRRQTGAVKKHEKDACYAILADGELDDSNAKHSRINKKPKYKIDLSSQMAECESSYFRLLKMLPNFENCDEWSFIVGRDASQVAVRIAVIDRAPYTSTLRMTQKASASENVVGDEYGNEGDEPVYLKTPALTIRLYHDAGMAEVIAWENHRRLRPRYSYPNNNMYQVDEKAQCNRYLADWLVLCQAQGRATVNMSDLGLPSFAYK